MKKVNETHQDVDVEAKEQKKPTLEEQLQQMEMEQKQVEQHYHQITGAIAMLRNVIEQQK